MHTHIRAHTHTHTHARARTHTQVVGVIVAKNKIGKDHSEGGMATKVVPFTKGDERVLQTLASHAAGFMKHVNNAGD